MVFSLKCKQTIEERNTRQNTEGDIGVINNVEKSSL